MNKRFALPRPARRASFVYGDISLPKGDGGCVIIFCCRTSAQGKDGNDVQWQGMRIYVVLLSLIIALSAFLGAHWLYNRLNFQQPLAKKLDGNELVTAYRLENDGEVYKITVTLRKTGNLMLSYRQVHKEVEKVMGCSPFVIEINDQPNDKLNDVYNQGQFAIQEALIRGNFQDMASFLNGYARSAGVTSKVFIDQDNIYWQMEDGANYLYQVIPRKNHVMDISNS